MLNRKLAPPYQKTLSISIPKPVEVSLSSGSRIFLLPQIQQNVAKLEVVFCSGRWFEPKIGLSHFASTLLEKGTAKKTAAEIANTLDYFGASIEIQPGYDFVSVAIYSLKTQWKNIFPLFMEILQEPSFPANEWNLARDIFLQNLKINNEKTSFRASAQIRKNIFGERHPYGSSIEEAHVQALSVADFRDYFKSAFRIHSAYGVGNFDDAEIRLMQESLGLIGSGGSFGTMEKSPDAMPVAFREEKPGSVQSSIRMGKRSLRRNDPDYAGFLTLNHLLGGFFGSRLMKNIREEKGLTYGIYSSTQSFANDSLFSIGADVNKSNLEEAIREIKSEVRRLGEEIVSNQELSLAKNHFIGSLQADMANLFSVSDKIKNMELYHLPRSYYQELLSHIDRVTPEDIIRLAGKYMKVDSLFEVAVG